MTSLIRLEVDSDYSAIGQLCEESFPTGLERQLVEALRAREELLVSVVAESAGRIVGHAAFSPVFQDDFLVGVGLAPVCVAESERRKGHGEELIRFGLEMCRGLGYANAVVLGEPSYYCRFGFRPATEFSLRLHDGSDGGSSGAEFQARELRPGGMPPLGGVVRYCEAFSARGGAER